MYDVKEIAPLGYAGLNGKISYEQKLASGELKKEVADSGAEIIKGGECMKDITDKDDGCIDGRLAIRLLFPNGIEGEDFNEVEITDALDHHRAKVAGGGYITALAMKLALDGPSGSINQDLQSVADHLTRYGIYGGTHTGDHSHDGAVDCGANDRFSEIIQTGDDLRANIATTVQAVLPLCHPCAQMPPEITERTGRNTHAAATNEEYAAASSGEARFGIIMNTIAEVQANLGNNKPVSVSKHLEGGHKEAFIVINAVPGKTFSQAAFHEQLKAANPDVADDALPQAFALDLPRVVELAEAMSKGHDNEQEAFAATLYAGLAFQFATAATLTDGTLRTFVVQ